LQTKNYRSILLFPTSRRFLNQLWYFVCQRSKQNSEVSTYISSHSAITNLLSFAQFVAESFDGKIQVGIIITDFSKTFDRLGYYYVLLRKLHCRNYFNHIWWKKKNNLWNVTTDLFGVPQGSVLGPLLLNILFIM
jgi:hypothetical protein